MAKKDLGLLVLLLVDGGITAALNPLFLSSVNLLNMANLIGLFGIFSIGEGIVIITGGIDLSVGSMFALLGVVFIDLLVNRGLPWPAALLATVAGGIVLGAVQGFLVTKARLQPFIVTLCGLLIYRGAARYYTDDATMGFGYGSDFDWLGWLASGRSWGIPHSFMLLIVVAAVMWVVLHRSVFGRYLYAIGKNEEAARFSGISTNAVIAGAYIISGGLAGLSTILLVFYTNSVSPSLEAMNGLKDVIERNRLGQRLDSKIHVDHKDIYRVKSIPMCANHYLRGDCPYSPCRWGHEYKPTKSELEILKWLSRSTPCRHGTSCDDPKCIYGHHCLFTGEGQLTCTYANCKFPHDMHFRDHAPVRTLKVT